MKVQICTGSKCTFYGASNIIERVTELQQQLHLYSGIAKDATLDVELLPCQKFCKRENSQNSPVVIVDGKVVTDAKAEIITEMILNSLMEESNEK